MSTHNTIGKATLIEILEAERTETQDAINLLEGGDKQAAYYAVERAIRHLEMWIENYLDENELKSATVEDVKEVMLAPSNQEGRDAINEISAGFNGSLISIEKFFKF